LLLYFASIISVSDLLMGSGLKITVIQGTMDLDFHLSSKELSTV